ncbi:MAG: hypothetical protein A2Y41_11305 [Spirochaetes bacterium GWB1_36_13]|nr:MAG: hypothetical protein A2Y41_11305 [Spirochaetes bacterium GWB1_36_13]
MKKTILFLSLLFLFLSSCRAKEEITTNLNPNETFSSNTLTGQLCDSKFWGPWIRMDKIENWYIADRNIYITDTSYRIVSVSGTPQDTIVIPGKTLSLVSDNMLKVTDGGSIYYLFKNGKRENAFTATIKEATRALTLGNLASIQVVVVNTKNPSDTRTLTTDTSGVLSVSDAIPGDIYKLKMSGKADAEVKAPLESGQSAGTVVTSPVHSFKASVELPSEQPFVFADGKAYNLTIVITNTGSEDSPAPTVSLTSDPSSGVMLSGTTSNISLQTIEPGKSRKIAVSVYHNGITEGSKDASITVSLVEPGQTALTWEDSVSVRLYQTPLTFNFQATSALYGVILFPSNKAVHFSTQMNSFSIPHHDTGLRLAFSGASADTEGKYTVGLNHAVDSNYTTTDTTSSSYINPYSYEPNDKESEAKNILINSSLNSYLLKNDIDIYQVVSTVLPVPTGLQASNGTSSSSIELSWTASLNAQKYYIYSSTTQNGYFTLIGTVDAPSVSYSHSLPAGNTRYYKIQAYNSEKGFSEYTSAVQGASEHLYSFIKMIKSEGVKEGQLKQTLGITLDADGNIYVIDGINKRIEKFSPSGIHIIGWGKYYYNSSLTVDFTQPTDVATDTNKNVYVVDRTANYIMKFTPKTGDYCDSGSYEIDNTGYCSSGYFGGGTSLTKPENGKFINPYGITIYKEKIYVVDTGNKRIQRLSLDGNFEAWLGKYDGVPAGWHTIDEQPSTNTLDDGQLNHPKKVAFDSNDNIYIVDSWNSRVQKYSFSGTPLGWWGNSTDMGDGWHPSGTTNSVSQTTGDRGFSIPVGIAIYENYMYITDESDHKIRKIKTDGTNDYSSIGGNTALLKSPQGITFDTNGYFYVSNNSGVVNTTTYNTSIEKFARDDFGSGLDTCLKDTIARNLPNQGDFTNPTGILVDNNFIYVASSEQNKIIKFDLSGNYILDWGGTGSDKGKFNFSNIGGGKMFFDQNNNLYILDSSNNRIQKFDKDGNYIGKWGEMGIFFGIRHMAIDTNEYVYVLDVNSAYMPGMGGYLFNIKKFDKYGNLKLTFNGTYGTNPGEFTSVSTIAVDDSGNIYLSGYLNTTSKIQKYNSSFQYQTSFGDIGTADGQFYEISDMLIKDKFLYLAEWQPTGNRRIQKFSINSSSIGIFVSKIQGNYFTSPYGITIDSNGKIYVTDKEKNNIQIFEKQ